jgi:hypothetical protein
VQARTVRSVRRLGLVQSAGDADDGADARLHARAGGSIGEVCGAMRDVFGVYHGGAFF